MKSYFLGYINISIISSIIAFLFATNFGSYSLKADESYVKEIEINSSTKSDQESTQFPTNPFEMVEMIRRANSMNDATKPSDAIDDALKSFNMIEKKEKS